MNAVMATEITKGGSDLPNTVLPPDGQEALKISFVETMAIVAHERFDLISRLKPVYAKRQLIAHVRSPISANRNIY